MTGWFRQKTREIRETVDKELYDKAMDDNIRLKGQIDKLTLNNKKNYDKLNEAQAMLQELTKQAEEGSIKLGLLANDKTRKKDKYVNLLVENVKKILALEKKLNVLEDKNKKLKEKQSKIDTEIKDQTENIKQIEGEYLISSISSERRAKMSGKEEQEEKKSALSQQLKNANDWLPTLEKLYNTSHKEEQAIKEKVIVGKRSLHKPLSNESSERKHESPMKAKSGVPGRQSKDAESKKNKPSETKEYVVKTEENKDVDEKASDVNKVGWGEDIDIQ